MIGLRIREYRKAKSLKVKEFAALVGISQGSLSDIENEKSKPSADTLVLIVQHTDINSNWLLSGKGEMFLKESVPLNLSDTEKEDSILKLVNEKPDESMGKMSTPSEEPPPELMEILLNNPEAFKELKELAKEAQANSQNEKVTPLPIQNEEMDRRVQEEIPCNLEELFKVMLAVELTCQDKSIQLNPHTKVTAIAMIYDRWMKDKSVELSSEEISPILKLLSS